MRIALTKEAMFDGGTLVVNRPPTAVMADAGASEAVASGGVSASDYALTGLTRILLGTATVDWRQALVKRGETFAVEVRACVCEKRVCGGGATNLFQVTNLSTNLKHSPYLPPSLPPPPLPSFVFPSLIAWALLLSFL